MLAWEGAGICKGAGGGITLSFCTKLVYLYPIMALCLETWESAAERLKVAVFSCERTSPPYTSVVARVGPLLQHVHHSWQLWEPAA